MKFEQGGCGRGCERSVIGDDDGGGCGGAAVHAEQTNSRNPSN